MIKFFITVAVVLLANIYCLAQNNNKNIPPFKIRLTNGEGYTYSDLKKDKPLILIYFSPSCEHCKVFTQNMLKRINSLKNYQLVMISYVDLKDVKDFDDSFHLSTYQNIKIGSEGYTFVVQKFYNIQHFPFVAEFDKTNMLKKIISWNQKPENIALQL